MCVSPDLWLIAWRMSNVWPAQSPGPAASARSSLLTCGVPPLFQIWSLSFCPITEAASPWSPHHTDHQSDLSLSPSLFPALLLHLLPPSFPLFLPNPFNLNRSLLCLKPTAVGLTVGLPHADVSLWVARWVISHVLLIIKPQNSNDVLSSACA